MCALFERGCRLGLLVTLIAVVVSGCAGGSGRAGNLHVEKVVLTRTGPAEATVGVISLPLPREGANELRVDHGTVGVQPVGWWERDVTPRRVMACVVGQEGVPETLKLKRGEREAGAASTAWKVEYHTTFERLHFERVPAWEYDTLRGFPADKSTLVEGEVRLSYGNRTVSLQFGATGPDEGSGGPGAVYYWQNVQIDRLWSNEAVQAVRVGGVIYNSDTFLCADVYLLLFSNGVAQVSSHFVNTRLAIDGYEFIGLPVIRFSGDVGKTAAELALPADGMRHRLGGVDMNLGPSGHLCSEREPGRLVVREDEVLWYPVHRAFFPRQREPDSKRWIKGMARTVDFTMSLSEAAAVVTRYRAPGWWYAACGEFWPWDYLPVVGPSSVRADRGMREMAKGLVRGRFDAGRGDDDGGFGEGLMRLAYRSGDPAVFDAALMYCVYWTDLMLDHDDHTAHQLVGWPYKTAAYTKFRDVVFAWLETGDPYYLDNAEMTAEGYWAWHRSNWPRNTIGRDNYSLGGWALLWKYMDTQHARDRVLEMVRMNRVVYENRGTFGGQMGAGPHSGYHDSLFLTGVAMEALLDVAEVMVERGDAEGVEGITEMIAGVTPHFMSDDREYYPSEHGKQDQRSKWVQSFIFSWRLKTMRIYAEMARLRGSDGPMTHQALAKAWDHEAGWGGRDTTRYLAPSWADALLLGARRVGDGVALNPIGSPEFWPAHRTVATPFGDLTVTLTRKAGRATLSFSSDRTFPVTVRYGDVHTTTTSNGLCGL